MHSACVTGASHAIGTSESRAAPSATAQLEQGGVGHDQGHTRRLRARLCADLQGRARHPHASAPGRLRLAQQAQGLRGPSREHHREAHREDPGGHRVHPARPPAPRRPPEHRHVLGHLGRW